MSTSTRKATKSVKRKAQVSVRKLMIWFEKQIPEHSKVGNSPIIAHDKFPWADTLERDWKNIRRELDEIMAHHESLANVQDISAELRRMQDDDKWKTFFFFGFGNRFTGNCARCPQTAALLGSIPGITTAFFSILSPGKQIPPHRGIYKGVVRYHLGVKVPEPGPDCAIRVEDQTVSWSEGEGFFFDDVYEHEAWNRTNDVRVVLLLDVLRPLPFPYSALNKFIVYSFARTPFVRNAKEKQEAWERGFEKLLNSK